MGQTGSVVLSDEMIQYKLGKKRTVRYWYVKTAHGFRAEVIGPFHSALYGACSFGVNKRRAKAALQRRLGNDHGYIGLILMSNKDEADNVGEASAHYGTKLFMDDRKAGPINMAQLVGSAGM